MGGLCLPLGLSKCEQQRFTVRLVHVATQTQYTSQYMNHCTMPCKHKALKSLSQIQRLILKGRCSEKQPYNKLPDLDSIAINCAQLRPLSASEALIFKISLREDAPRFPHRTLCAIHTQTTVHYACHINSHSICMPTLLQSPDQTPVGYLKNWALCKTRSSEHYYISPKVL